MCACFIRKDYDITAAAALPYRARENALFAMWSNFRNIGPDCGLSSTNRRWSRRLWVGSVGFASSLRGCCRCWWHSSTPNLRSCSPHPPTRSNSTSSSCGSLASAPTSSSVTFGSWWTARGAEPSATASTGPPRLRRRPAIDRRPPPAPSPRSLTDNCIDTSCGTKRWHATTGQRPGILLTYLHLVSSLTFPFSISVSVTVSLKTVSVLPFRNAVPWTPLPFAPYRRIARQA